MEFDQQKDADKFLALKDLKYNSEDEEPLIIMTRKAYFDTKKHVRTSFFLYLYPLSHIYVPLLMSVTWFQKVADKKDNDGPIPASRAAEIENVEYEVSVNGIVETLLIL